MKENNIIACPRKYTIKIYNQNNNVIPAIRAVRRININWGLRESKDFVERALDYPTVLSTHLSADSIHAYFNEEQVTITLREIKEDTQQNQENQQNRQVVITDLRPKTNPLPTYITYIPKGTFFTGTIGEDTGLFVKCEKEVMMLGTDIFIGGSICYCRNYQPVRVEILIKEEIPT